MNCELDRAVPLYKQIGSRLEVMILDGSLKSGDRLPTTQDLARDFGVTVQTTQQAVSLLSQRGMLERIPGRGTFVSARIHSRRIGIVFGANVFGRPEMLFFQSLYALIIAELKRLKWESSLFFPAGEEDASQLLAELDRETLSGRLRGLIYLSGTYPYSEWLEKNARIPHNAEHSSRDTADSESDLYRGLDYLLGRGYRRIAVISHLPPGDSSPASSALMSAAALAYARHGLPMQAIVVPGWAASHRHGIERAREALDGQGGGKPDALLVLNDLGAMGVIFELLSRGLRIPQDIAVMATANKGIEIPCPCPLTRLEKDPADLARLLIEEVTAKIEGREAQLPPWKSSLMVGQSCGE